ncbi:MAG: histone deacetylase, partial [Planctomycetaceae bacterium]
ERIDCDLPLPANCPGNSYLKILIEHLPGFIDACSRSQRVDLAIYNAGTDVVRGDPLGGLELTPDQVLERDLFVFAQFRQRGIPVVMLPSGGYTAESYRLIASTVAEMLKQYGRQGHGA